MAICEWQNIPSFSDMYLIGTKYSFFGTLPILDHHVSDWEHLFLSDCWSLIKKNLSYHSFWRFVWVTESLLKLSWKSGLLPISHFSSIYFSIFLSIFHQVLAHILLKLSERTKTPYDTIFLNYYSFPDAPLQYIYFSKEGLDDPLCMK